MRNAKSEKIEQLSVVFIRIFNENALKKAILSKPDSSDEIKSVVSPIVVKGMRVLQIETFSKDNKAYHRNVSENFDNELYNLFSMYSQINVLSSVGECQYMRSKNGKETLIGDKKILSELERGNFEKEQIRNNNKEKNYILSPDTPFLKKLGISDETGRVRDRMQSKYRQINKFVEHVDEICEYLPKDKINVYDLCCGKSYLSFAVYHYFKNVRKIDINMICIDIKKDVIEYCSSVSERLGFDGMKFICGDINEYVMDKTPDLVVSLHACDVATDYVLDKASDNGAKVILSTPCCHHELNHKINCEELSFITEHSMLRQKFCDAATDALRILKLQYKGYDVSALELIDPEDTPKNILIRAIKKDKLSKEKENELKEKYITARKFLLGK